MHVYCSHVQYMGMFVCTVALSITQSLYVHSPTLFIRHTSSRSFIYPTFHLLSLSCGPCSLSYPTPGSSDTFYKEQVSHEPSPPIDTLFSMLMLSVCFLRTCFAPIDVRFVSPHVSQCTSESVQGLLQDHRGVPSRRQPKE